MIVRARIDKEELLLSYQARVGVGAWRKGPRAATARRDVQKPRSPPQGAFHIPSGAVTIKETSEIGMTVAAQRPAGRRLGLRNILDTTQTLGEEQHGQPCL